MTRQGVPTLLPVGVARLNENKVKEYNCIRIEMPLSKLVKFVKSTLNFHFLLLLLLLFLGGKKEERTADFNRICEAL